MLPPQEPLHELERKGNTSMIKIFYPVPEQQTTPQQPVQQQAQAMETHHHAHAQQQQEDAPMPSVPPMPPVRKSSSLASAHQAMMMRADSQMGLDNFKFCTVLGRGHFGKVSLRNCSIRSFITTSSS